MSKAKPHFLYRLRNIEKTFDLGAVSYKALRGIDLELGAGELVALRGPSGSGKSTLLNVLGILEVPTAGQIEFAGRKLQGLSEQQLTEIRRQSIGFIFQNYNLMPIFTAQENVEYPLYLERKLSKPAIQERAMQMLADVGLAQFSHHKPAELSGGQRQRVAIARALVKDPDVVLADEPTANLDSKTAEQILELLRDLQKRKAATIIIATHDDHVASIAQRSIHIRDGVVVE